MRLLLKIAFILCFMSGVAFGQDTVTKIYNPMADGKAQLAKAVKMADSTDRQVFIQVGGNWCKWCIRFTKFCKADTIIDTLLNNNYVVVHLNYSKENKNLDILKSLGYPQRFGFPVIVILDNKGNRIHTQDSGFLESGEGYDQKKVIQFLSAWTRKALDPKLYDK
jgi:thioredoxin-related protein